MQLHFFQGIAIIRKVQQREDGRMAASKGRKNSKKRAQIRRSPQNQAEHEQIKQEQAKKKGGFWRSGLEVVDPINLVGFILMIVGFLVAVAGDFGLYAYPVTFIGAFLCLIRTKPDTRSNKISVAVYIIYLLCVVYLWVGCLKGTA